MKTLKSLIQQSGITSKTNNQYLNYPNCQIVKIDLIEQQIAVKVKYLNLQKNQIKKLDEIERFTSLQILNLSHNKISSGLQVLKLQQLKRLKKIYFTGNPFLNNPLQQSVLTLLSGYQNDIQVLEYAFRNQEREKLVYQNKLKKSRSKSPITYNLNENISRISSLSHLQRSKQQKFVHKQWNNNQHIEQRQQEHENSNQSLNYNTLKQNKKQNVNLFDRHLNRQTPIRNNHQIQRLTNINNSKNQTIFSDKFEAQSTNQKKLSLLKEKNVNKNQSFLQSYLSKYHNKNVSHYKGSEYYKQENQKIQNFNKNQHYKSASNNYQSISNNYQPISNSYMYEIDGMKINLESDIPEMNYPSIIEKQFQDSYEIQIDFMSPKKLQLSKRSIYDSIQNPPEQNVTFQNKNTNLRQPSTANHQNDQLKQVKSVQKNKTAKQIQKQKQILIIDQTQKVRNETQIEKQNEKTERKLITPKNKSSFVKNSVKQILYKTKQTKNIQPSFSIQKDDKYRQTQREESRIVSKNEIPRLSHKKQIAQVVDQRQQIQLLRQGSLSQSTRYYQPQTNVSNTYQLINRVFQLAVGDLQLKNQSPSQIMQNLLKFQKFYYNSLSRFRPAFNLLYSPLNTLNVQQKNMLLQELFKNHKEIFMILIKQSYLKRNLQNQLINKQNQLIKKQNQITNKNDQITNKKQEIQTNHLYHKQVIKKISEENRNNCQTIQKLIRISQSHKNTINEIQDQNGQLRQKLSQQQNILASRQKLIADVQIQYEKVNKIFIKQQRKINKFLNQDQIEDKISQIRQKRLKKVYFKRITQKALKCVQIQTFSQIRQSRQKRRQKIQQNEYKKIIFIILKQNLIKKQQINRLINKSNLLLMKNYFQQIKMQAITSYKTKILTKLMNIQNKRQFISILNKFKICANKSKLIKQRQKQIKLSNQKKLKHKIFIQTFKRLFYVQNDILIKNENKAMNHLKLKLFQKYISYFKIFVTDEKQKISKQIAIIKIQIIKSSISIFKRVIKLQNRQLNQKQRQIRMNILSKFRKFQFFKLLIKKSSANLQAKQKKNRSLKYIINKYFNTLKGNSITCIKRNTQISKALRKVYHLSRINELVQIFKQNYCQQQINKLRIRQFLNIFKHKKLDLNELNRKKQQVGSYMNFRKSFKGKHNFIHLLRFLTLHKKQQQRIKSLQTHYLTQQLKFKQSYELNIQTIESLKHETNHFMNEIQFLKNQILTLTQRQLYILQTKQQSLLQMKQREQQNIELRSYIINKEQQLKDLQIKYQKSLDMYAEAIQQINQKQIKIDSNVFLHETISRINNKSPRNQRVDLKQSTYTSSKK